MKTLGSIVKYKKGKPPKTGPNGGLPVLSPHYLRTGQVEEMVEVTSKDVVLNGGEIVLLWDGSNAGEFFRARPGVLSSTMVVFEFDQEETDADYLYYDLKRFEPELKGRTAGSGIPHVDKELLLGREIFEGAPDEQKMAATVLLKVDCAIEQTEAVLLKQERIKKGLMQDLLTRGLDAQGRLRDSASHPFKSSAVGLIPKEWAEGTIATKATLHNNLRKPLSAVVRERMKGVFPYFGPTGILGYINEYRLEGRFVLIGEDGDHFLKFATHEMTRLVDGRFNVNNHAHVLTGRNGCSTEWLHHFFRHRDLTYFLTRQGAGRFKLNKAAVLSLPLPVPSLDEQARIADRLVSDDRLLLAIKEQLVKLIRLKNGLMNDLLTGRVPITPLLSRPST